MAGKPDIGKGSISPVIKRHLDAASRTFALVLPMLPTPLGNYLGAAYLVARVADEFEDNPRVSKNLKYGFMREVNQAMWEDAPTRVRNLGTLLGSLETTEPGYRQLLDGLVEVHEEMRAFPDSVRDSIKRYGDEMIGGMASGRVQNIKTFDDHYRYCHYVAGVWGYLITELTQQAGYFTEQQVREKLMPKPDEWTAIGVNPAHDFALALQLTNDTKDLHADHQAGIHRWPSDLLKARNLSFDDLMTIDHREHPSMEKAYSVLRMQVDDARRYVKAGAVWLDALPYGPVGNRRCWGLALGMAASTLRHLNSPAFFYDPESRKMGRLEVAALDQRIIRETRAGRPLTPLMTHLLDNSARSYSRK